MRKMRMALSLGSETASQARAALACHASTAKARLLQRYFKTAPGEYGAGDMFIGVTVPNTRSVARRFRDLALPEVAKLLRSKIHEERLLALLILVDKYARAGTPGRTQIYRFYRHHLKWINNWDLVDTSAPQIVGAYVFEQGQGRELLKFLRSGILWERRIAIVASYRYIREGEFALTLTLAQRLLSDPEDLMHKATGWMLREVGKRDVVTLERFLAKYASRMPRTMLRYAIERFSASKRRTYLAISRVTQTA